MMMIASPASAAAKTVRLASDTNIATAGNFQLRWTADSAVQLEEATSPDFRTTRSIYSGRDKARVMSGKADGDWYYRARPAESDGNWSSTVKVTVRHHPLRRAIGFFVVGAVVFFATLLLVVGGTRRET
ncbi:MAG TPA: hypothetical protein VNQ14_03960 [Woeseiaceae bacterium]|nr:hypothetical protein [Woeseiaceae bacterium]